MQAALLKVLGIPPADQSVPQWHVSPIVDVVSYHFSWLWVLIPLLMMGNDYPNDYFHLYVAVLVISIPHRHVTFPYAYLDSQVFQTSPYKFTVFPGLLMIAWLLTPRLVAWRIPIGWFSPVTVTAAVAFVVMLLHWWSEVSRGHTYAVSFLSKAFSPLLIPLGMYLALPRVGPSVMAWTTLMACVASSCLMAWDGARSRAESAWRSWVVPWALLGGFLALAFWPDSTHGLWPPQRVLGATVFAGIATFAALWNIWHTFMQKYGILRMYNAKSGVEVGRQVPGWVDRFLVFGFLPLFFVYMGPKSRPQLEAGAKVVLQYVNPIVEAMEAVQPFLLVPSVLIAAGSVGGFLFYEHRASGLNNMPRLSMGLGTVALNCCFLVFDPIKVFIAYGFSHAIEYFVFVWAFQRRRYSHQLSHDPLWGRLLKWPWLSYGGMIVAVGLAYFLLQHGDDYLWEKPIYFGEIPAYKWVFYWTVYQSMMHFYFDGFLWKMRLPAVRASI